MSPPLPTFTETASPLATMPIPLATAGGHDLVIWRAGLPLLTILLAWTGMVLPYCYILHDDGQMGLCAERVLKGEWPHRDFDEAYTGGLTWLHAGAFAIAGPSLLTLRLVLFGGMAFFLALYYRLATRWTHSVGAGGLLAVMATAWTLPDYPLSMPSWYLLFLAIGCITTFDEAIRRATSQPTFWHTPIFWGGCCAGIAITIKITGLYLVAGGLLALFFWNQARALSSQKGGVSLGLWSLLVLTGGLAGCVLLLVRRHLDVAAFLHYLLPALSLCLALIIREIREQPAWTLERWRHFGGTSFSFGVGVAVPLLAFLTPWLLTGHIGALINGVLVQPQLRLQAATHPLPPLHDFLPTIPLLLLVIPQIPSWLRLMSLAILTALLTVGASPLKQGPVFPWAFAMWRCLLPGLCLLVACRWITGTARSLPTDLRLSLLAAITAFLSLNQYPYPFALYFQFFSPLVFLLTATLLVGWPSSEARPGWCVLVASTVFGTVAMGSGAIIPETTAVWQGRGRSVLPATERASVRVAPSTAYYLDTLISRIRNATSPGQPILATPDCPEIYFLANRPNPTRYLYDFFDPSPHHEELLLQTVVDQKIPIVVIRRQPQFSQPITPEFRQALNVRYRHQESIGPFDVYSEGQETP